jgi:hypothetical protein
MPSGVMFETYCGTMLGLLEHAEVRPEIVYGKPERKTVDHFVISPEAVVLVEEKSARPTRATRLGEPAGDDDTANKLGNAYDQIERTAPDDPRRPPCGRVDPLRSPADRPRRHPGAVSPRQHGPLLRRRPKEAFDPDDDRLLARTRGCSRLTPGRPGCRSATARRARNQGGPAAPGSRTLAMVWPMRRTRFSTRRGERFSQPLSDLAAAIDP